MNIAVATNRYTAALRAHERHSAAQIHDAHERLKRETAIVFALLLKHLAQAHKSGEHSGIWWLYEHNRMQQVQETVSNAVTTFANTTADTVHQGRQHAIEVGAAAAVSQLSKRIKQVAHPEQGRMATLAGGVINRFKHWVNDTVQRIQSALLLAASLGITLAMAENLLNSAIDRLLPLAIGNDVTAEYEAFRDALSAYYQANSEVVQAWQWATAEDERVCPFCDSMDGSIHALTESLDSHPRCRCEMEPYFIDTSGEEI